MRHTYLYRYQAHRNSGQLEIAEMRQIVNPTAMYPVPSGAMKRLLILSIACVVFIMFMMRKSEWSRDLYMIGQIHNIYPAAVRSTPLRSCSQRYRLELMKKTCDVYHRYDKRSHFDDVDVDVIAVNHKKRLFYCALPKAGSRSWLSYMVNISSDIAEPWRIRDDNFMRKAGLEYRRKVPLAEVKSKYKNYTKFTVVRHPLQWIVGVYFEAIHRTGKYGNVDGSKSTLQEFVDRLYFYPGFKKAWQSFESICHHCQIDYDYIIKSETLEEDGKMLSHALDTDVLPPFVHVNSRFEQDHESFKYDTLLQEMEKNETDIIYKLLTYYDKDIKMFGYQWDNLAKTSFCSNWDEIGNCC